MSFLPYGGGGPGAWIFSGATSLAVHAGMITFLTVGVTEFFQEREVPITRPEFEITLEQFDTLALVGPELSEGTAEGLDDADEAEALDALDLGEDLDALDGEDVEETDALDAEEAEVDEAEALDAETLDEAEDPDDAEEAEAAEAEALDADDAEEAEIAEAEALEAEDLEEADAAEALEAEETDEADVTEADTLEAEEIDAAEAVEPDALDADDAEVAETEAVDALGADEVAEAEALDALGADDAPEAEALDAIGADDAPEAEALDALDADDAPEAEALDALGADDVAEAEALDALGADDAPEAEALDALGADDVAEAEALDELDAAEAIDAPLAPEIDDISAVLPEETATLAPVETDPLLAEEGAAPVVGGEALDAAQPAEQVFTPVIDGGSDAAVVSGGGATAIVGADPVTEAPAAEDFAVLAPQAAELPPVGGQDEVTPAAQPLEPAANAAAEVEAIAPVEPVEPVASESPAIEASDVTPRRRQPRVPPSARDLAVGDLIQRIRANTNTNDGGDCVIALPRRDGEEGIGLALLSAQDSEMERFADQVLTREADSEIRQTRGLVDERQCAALNYIAQNRDYPSTRVGIRLDSTEVPSGNRVSGIMRGIPGRNLSLFLVDNNGVVQDVDRFLSTSGDFFRFDVPVTRVGPRRDTKQLLVAVASTESLEPLKSRAGNIAEDFFDSLNNDLARQAALALVAFDVR